MRKIERPVAEPRRRKGIQLTEREISEVFAGGRFELEPGRDFTGSPTTASNQLRALWVSQYGRMRTTVQDDVLVVDVQPPDRLR